MAVNQSRSMSLEFQQGTSDSSYMSLTPDRGGVMGNVPTERMSWPSYQQVEQHNEPKFATDTSCHHGKSIEYTR
jgi:hypothetical protein